MRQILEHLLWTTPKWLGHTGGEMKKLKTDKTPAFLELTIQTNGKSVSKIYSVKVQSEMGTKSPHYSCQGQ